MDDVLPPQAKRVRRNELYARSRSSSASETSDGEQGRLVALLKQRSVGNTTFRAFELESPKPSNGLEIAYTPSITNTDADAPETQAYSFRLFLSSRLDQSQPSNATNDAQTNVVHGDTRTAKTSTIFLSPPDHEQPYPLPGRQASYYFADPPTAPQAASFNAVALTTADVLARAAWARKYWLAHRHSGRIVHLRTSSDAAKSLALPSLVGAATAAPTASESSERVRRRLRCRRSKKTRIRMRVRTAARAAKEEAAHAAQEAKDAAVREKKTLLNRKKQQRKRAKARVAGCTGPASTTVVPDA